MAAKSTLVTLALEMREWEIEICKDPQEPGTREPLLRFLAERINTPHMAEGLRYLLIYPTRTHEVWDGVWLRLHQRSV